MDAANEDPIYAPTLIIATVAIAITSLATVVSRLVIRWPWSQELRGDDVATFIAAGFAVTQSSLIFGAVHYGLGDANPHLRTHKLRAMEKCLYAGDLLFLFSIAASRVAACLLLLRLTVQNSLILTVRGIVVFTLLVCSLSVLAVGIRTGVINPWDLKHDDNGTLADAWLIFNGFGVFLDIALLIAPTLLVWGFPITPWDKLVALSGFWLRFPLISLAVGHGIVLHDALLHAASDVPSRMALPAIVAQIEMHWAVVVCTVPLYNIFFSRIATSVPALEDRVQERPQRDFVVPSQASYRMTNISRPQPMTTGKRPDLDIEDMEISVASNPAYYDTANSYSTGAPKRKGDAGREVSSPGPANRDYASSRGAPFAPGTAI